MTKNEFMKACAVKSGLTQKDMKEVLEIIGDMIVVNMKTEDGVTPFTGMKFVAEYKDPHVARNPLNGQQVNVPGKYRPKVKFGVAVKDALNA